MSNISGRLGGRLLEMKLVDTMAQCATQARNQRVSLERSETSTALIWHKRTDLLIPPPYKDN